MRGRTVEKALLNYLERHGAISLNGLCKELGLSKNIMAPVWDKMFKERGLNPAPRVVRVPQEYVDALRRTIEEDARGKFTEEVHEDEEGTGEVDTCCVCGTVRQED